MWAHITIVYFKVSINPTSSVVKCIAENMTNAEMTVGGNIGTADTFEVRIHVT